MMDCFLRRVWMLGVLCAALCAALYLAAPIKAADPNPYRDYVMWSNQEFTGAACASGWAWTDPENKSYYQCTGYSVLIKPQVSGNKSRMQGILYRNDLFPPADRNMAVEMLIHYPALHGYGTDAYKGYDGSYAGERTCFNGSNHYYGDSWCPTAHTATTLFQSHGKLYGDQRTADMYTGSSWVGFTENSMTPGWLIVRYEYDASTHVWEEYVYLPDHGTWEWTQPYRAKAPDHTATMTRNDVPRGIAIGHDVVFMGGGSGWGPGVWSIPEVNYIRVWTWTNPKIEVYARNPQGAAVNAARLGVSFFEEDGGHSGWLDFNTGYYATEIDPSITGDDSIYAIGGLLRTYANQEVVGVTPQPVLDTYENTSSGVTVRYDGVEPWVGNKSFYYILATQTPIPTLIPTTPTPTPWVHVEARNPQGEAVNVRYLGTSGWHDPGAPVYEAIRTNTHRYTGAFNPTYYGTGGAMRPYDNQVVLGVTPHASLSVRTNTDYYDGSPTWRTGRRDFTYVVATMTPTPTPTPSGSVRLRTLDAGGNPVEVPSIELLTSDGGSLNFTTGCVSCASATAVVELDNTLKGARAVLDPNGDLVVMNVTTSHSGGSPNGSAGWVWPAPWSGLRDILVEVATVTPTATPTNTPTPTPTPTQTPVPWEVRIPQGSVFVSVYVPNSDAEDRWYYATDHVFSLEIQRWSGMAPLFRTDGDAPVELCEVGGSCYPGHTLTTHFNLTDITHMSDSTPTFEYPSGKVISYHREHSLHDFNLEDDEYLWLLVLGQGGNMPDSPAGPQAIARSGRPGTYRFSGTLDIRSSWYAPTDAPIDHVHEWSIPIEFYAAVKAPYPQSP